MKFTDQIKQVLMQAKDHQATLNYVTKALQHYINEYKKAREQHDGPSTAYSFNKMMQEEVDEVKDHKVSCKAGCAACCYQNVDVTSDEAELLLLYCEDKKIEIDWDHVKDQLPGRAEIPYAKRKCVFLDDKNNCKVYEHRPHMCRKYYVVSKPELCDSDKYPRGLVQVITINQAELLSNAILVAAKESGDLPRMLLKNKKD